MEDGSARIIIISCPKSHTQKLKWFNTVSTVSHSDDIGWGWASSLQARGPVEGTVGSKGLTIWKERNRRGT